MIITRYCYDEILRHQSLNNIFFLKGVNNSRLLNNLGICRRYTPPPPPKKKKNSKSFSN